MANLPGATLGSIEGTLRHLLSEHHRTRFYYSIALLITVLSIIIDILLRGALHGAVVTIPVFGVAVASLFGGFAPGLLSAVIGGIAVKLLFFSRSAPFLISADQSGGRLVVFACASLLLAWLCGLLKKAYLDVTDKERRLAAKEQELEAAVRARDEVLAIVSHDLKIPLAGIDLSADILLRAADNLKETRINTQVLSIRAASKRMDRLISDLLDVSRIEAGHLALEKTECKVASLFEDAIKAVEPLSEEKGVRIESSTNCADLKIACDRDRIAQVLENLLGNAVKFSPEEQGVISITCEQKGEHVLFSISDNGPGIAPEELPHVFDRFWQAKRKKQGGAGLGLAIAQGILKIHGGEICADSAPGKGATFWFILPIAAQRKAA